MTSKVKIQMKVYDKDGRRVHVQESYFGEQVSAEDATKWVEEKCQELDHALGWGKSKDMRPIIKVGNGNPWPGGGND